MHQQRSGTRTCDVNIDGVANYGLFPDWVEDLRKIAGHQIVDDLANGAEAYLQMWARAEAAPQAISSPHRYDSGPWSRRRVGTHADEA